MKLRYTILSLCAASMLFTACSNDSDIMSLDTENVPHYSQAVTFPEADGSKVLTGDGTAKVRKLLEATGSNIEKGLGRISITDEQYNEIKVFTDDLVKNDTTEKAKFNRIYDWVITNIKYDLSDNDPYSVFKNKKGVCQGYANILTTMLHTQSILSFVANGQLVGYGGHAWNYVYHSGEWYVCDPTNPYFHSGMSKGVASIRLMSAYKKLQPSSVDAVLFEDEKCTYTYANSELNIASIKSTDEQLVLPYSINGFTITSMNPTEKLPSTVKEIYIGKNITTLGTDIIGLSYLAPSVEVLSVDPENKSIESFSNVIYKNDGSIYLIAPAATFIELKPIKYFDKESRIKDHKNLESIVFVPGTELIGAYAVENCPKLHTAYVPNNTEVEDRAFYGVAKNFQIVRGDFTNIPEIKE